MTSAHYDFAEHLLGTDLRAWIRTLRDEGRSFDSIARELWTATDKKVDVTGWSVRRWLNEEKVG